MKIAAKGADKLRWEMDDGAAKASGLDAGPVLTIADGKNTWTYLSKTNQYVVDPGSVADSLIKVSDLLPVYGAKLKDDAKLLREETISAGGKPVDCYVVEIPEEKEDGLYPQWWTWWVEKGRYVVWRADRRRVGPRGSDEATNVYGSVKIDQPISDSVFVFNPPPGAQKVDSFPP